MSPQADNPKPPHRKRRVQGLTPAIHKRLVEATKLGVPWAHAASYAGIHRNTLINWRERGGREKVGPYRELVDAMDAAEGEMIAANMALIRKAASEGAWQAAAWTLERRFEEFRKPRDREEVVMREIRAAEAAAPAGPSDPREVLAALPTEVLEELLAARKRTE